MTSILKNKIPIDWKEVNLGIACSFERGIEPGAEAYNSEGIGERFLRVVDVTESRNNSVYVDIVTTKKLKKEDIALTLDGTIGAIKRGLEGIYSTGVRKVSFKDNKNSNKLLYYILQSHNIQNTIDLYSSGSTIKHASSSIPYLTSAIPIAYNEQEKIAEILALIDNVIEETNALIEKYKSVKSGLMQYFFQYGIDKNGEIRNESTHSFKKTLLGMIPNEWDVVSVLDITDKITKGESPNWQGFSYQEEGIFFLTSENVRNGYVDYDLSKFIPPEFHSKLERSRLKKDDLLINLVGASIARTALFNKDMEANINQAVALVRFTGGIIPEFYMHYFQIPKNIDRLLGEQVETARANLSLTNIRDFLVVKPPKSEQVRITGFLSEIDRTIFEESTYLNKLIRIKQGLMEDLLSGIVSTQHLIKK